MRAPVLEGLEVLLDGRSAFATGDDGLCGVGAAPAGAGPLDRLGRSDAPGDSSPGGGLSSCRNLAPHVLGQLLRRQAPDFEARYGYAPWPVETFVDGAAPLGGAHLVTVEELVGEDPMA